jgi:ribose/xylose/arabinose/galactoside ABC-type transport system permease subunit
MSVAAARPRIDRSDLLARFAIWIVLILLLLIAAAASKGFREPVYLLNVVRQAAPVGIAAIGVTFVMILGGVDLSVGAVISLTAVVAAIQMNGDAANLAPALLVTCGVGVAVGLVNGLLIAFNRISPFIVTLGTAIVIYGATMIYSGGTAAGTVSPGFREFFNERLLGLVPVLALAFLLLAAVAIWMQHGTRLGRSLYLIGANREAALLSGLPVRFVTVAAYTLSGLAAALGGIALLARTGVSSTYAGRGYEFDVLAAVVLGGTTFIGGRGGVGGTVAGVFVLFIAFNLANMVGLPFAAQLALKGVIIIAASAAYESLRRRG